MRKKLLKTTGAVTMPAIRQEISNAVDELAATSGNQFTRIDTRFDKIEERLSEMATKTELRIEIDGLYQNMVRRFDAVDRRFDKQEEFNQNILTKMDNFIIFMRGHEKRIDKIEKHLEFV